MHLDDQIKYIKRLFKIYKRDIADFIKKGNKVPSFATEQLVINSEILKSLKKLKDATTTPLQIL